MGLKSNAQGTITSGELLSRLGPSQPGQSPAMALGCAPKTRMAKQSQILAQYLILGIPLGIRLVVQMFPQKAMERPIVPSLIILCGEGFELRDPHLHNILHRILIVRIAKVNPASQRTMFPGRA